MEKAKDVNNYTWYKIQYNQRANGTFASTGYISRGPVNKSEDYYFGFLDTINVLDPNPVTLSENEELLENQENPELPAYAILNGEVIIRKGATRLSSHTSGRLPKGTRIIVVQKMPDRDGFKWYKIEYNYQNGICKDTAYIIRHNNYSFKYLNEADWTKCPISNYVKPVGTDTSDEEKNLSNQVNPTLPAYAVLNGELIIREGAARKSSKITGRLPKDTRMRVVEKMPNNDGFSWYKVEYNYKDGKYNNSGYIIRHGTSTFRYIENPNWELCEYVKSLGKIAKVTAIEGLNVRKDAGSVQSERITKLSLGTTFNVLEKMPDKDGYSWYKIEYNYQNGKYQNLGYVAGQDLNTKEEYFVYI